MIGHPESHWLIARPIAHRGLHNERTGRCENSLSAARSAIERRFAIECDVQRSADGEAMVFHDFSLDRLTNQRGGVAERSAAVLSDLRLGNTTDGIPTLRALLDLIAGRVPLICEVKSAFDGDVRLADRVLDLVGSYSGPLAVKSFDPAVVVHLRAKQFGNGRNRLLGIVAEARYDDSEWNFLDTPARQRLAALSDFAETDPDFLSYSVTDLPHAAATLFRHGLNRPVVTWTVRTPEQRKTAASFADQIVFELLDPDVMPQPPGLPGTS